MQNHKKEKRKYKKIYAFPRLFGIFFKLFSYTLFTKETISIMLRLTRFFFYVYDVVQIKSLVINSYTHSSCKCETNKHKTAKKQRA